MTASATTASADPDRTQFPVCRFLEEHFETIRGELDALPESEFLPWCDAGAYRGDWRVLGLHYARSEHAMLDHVRDVERRNLCPRTRALLARIPGLLGSGFSWLGPGTHVLPHTDFEDVRAYRFHLGLRVDPRARMRLGGEWVTWEAGRCLVFDPRTEHEVRHEGAVPRIVLFGECERARALEPLLTPAAATTD